MKRFLIAIWLLCSIIPIFSDPSGYFKGFVFDRKSKYPIANAQLELSGRVSFTDNKGFFEFRNLIVGNLILKITSESHNDVVELVKISNGTNSQNFYMEPKAVKVNVRGKIENIDTGLGVPNVNIAFDNVMSQTDDYGEFYMDNMKPGRYVVRIQDPDYEKYIDEINVTDAQTNNFKFLLKPLVRYGKIIGEIRNSGGELVESAQVVVGNNQPVEVSGGKFVLEDIVQAKYRLIVYADGYEPYEEWIMVEELTRAKVILQRDRDFKYADLKDDKKKFSSPQHAGVVKKFGSLEGYVRDAKDFKLLQGVTLVLGEKYTVSGPDGMYYFNNIDPGNYTLSIISKKHGVYAADIYIKPGAGIFNISLKDEEKEGVIFGKVFEKSSNKAIIDAKVEINGKSVKTDDKGYYEFKVKREDYSEIKVFLGRVQIYRKIIYITKEKTRHDIFVEVR